ncbi:MAG: hypothetical protein ACKVWR_08150 [Acidimicrobiales bacterium]
MGLGLVNPRVWLALGALFALALLRRLVRGWLLRFRLWLRARRRLSP